MEHSNNSRTPPGRSGLRFAVAVLVGLIGCVFVWVLTPYSSYLLNTGHISDSYLPVVALFVFLVLLVGYMWVSVKWARQHPEALAHMETARAAGSAGPAVLVSSLGVLAVGLALVLVGSIVLIGSVEVLARRCNVPRGVLAVTLVAFGTSLPELVTAVTSVIKGHPEIAIGNVNGADILNVLFVVGASATAMPLAVPTTFFYFHLPVMMLALTLMGVYIFTNKATFKRWQGVPLLAIYVGYVVILLVKFGGGRSQ